MTYNNNKGEFEVPYKIIPLESGMNKKIMADFEGETTGFYQVGEKKWFFPSNYKKMANHFYNFEARPDDIWIVTYPRSGTTWSQELIWLIANDLDYETALSVPLTKRFPFLEFAMFVHPTLKKKLICENQNNPANIEFIHEITKPGYEFLNDIKSSRFIKTHFPPSLLPPSIFNVGCKVIYVARNPTDVAVSCYHQNRLLRTQGYVGDFKTYWEEYFESGLLPYGFHWHHVQEGWELRNNPNILFMFYEEMDNNLPESIHKISKFLNKSNTDSEIEKLTKHLSIKHFRENNAVNGYELKMAGIMKTGEQGFVRKGKTENGWSEEFTPELKDRATNWIRENSRKFSVRYPIKDILS